jgi:pimeloyl-ACP methyl ester carboxylesterase
MPYIMNDNINIYYQVEGEGECIVLHHGLYGSIEDWYEFGYVTALKNQYKLIMIDARGHGKSDKPYNSDQYSLYLRASDVIKVLDAERIATCHYVGYSMGGWISFGLMRWFKNRVKTFCLIAIHPYENDMLTIKERVRALDSWVPESNLSNIHKLRILKNDREALTALIADKREDNSALLKDISVPCMMLDGEEDEFFNKIQEGSKLSQLITFVPIPLADHGSSLYRGDIVVPHIKQFIGSE